MKGEQLSIQQIIDTVGEWHDHAEIHQAQNQLLSVFCAFAEIFYNGPQNGHNSSRDVNALRVALEAAYQLGRANCRDQTHH